MSKNEKYELLYKQVLSLAEGERDREAMMANTAALIHEAFGFWWTGFYRVVGEELVLGPFQGPVACSRIPFGRGVCGTAWQLQRTLVVPDVEQFPGHIACSSASRSEIVVPLICHDRVVAVLDIDSEHLATFDETDQAGLEKIAEVLAPLYFDIDNFQSNHGKIDERTKQDLKKAENLAREAHQGQTDKSGADYIGHPLRVSTRCKSPEAKIAGLLHDTIEDTYVTPQLLKDMGFGDEIVDAVLALSRRADETYAEFIVRTSQNEIAKEVKIADLEDNMDIRRLPEISGKDAARLKKYLHSWRYLQGLEKTTDLIRD